VHELSTRTFAAILAMVFLDARSSLINDFFQIDRPVHIVVVVDAAIIMDKNLGVSFLLFVVAFREQVRGVTPRGMMVCCHLLLKYSTVL